MTERFYRSYYAKGRVLVSNQGPLIDILYTPYDRVEWYMDALIYQHIVQDQGLSYGSMMAQPIRLPRVSKVIVSCNRGGECK